MRVRKDDVAVREVGGELVVLDLKGSRYLSVTGVGVRLFDLLSSDQSASSLVEVLLEEYDVARDVARADVDAFLAQLRSADLIEE